MIPKARALRPRAGIYGVPVMRSADRFDLANFDIPNLELPASGERNMRDTQALNLALRLRAGGSRT